jgi:hypothetical protein
MPSALRVGDIRAALAERAFPTITAFNRLEGRPRTRSFDRALRAEVRDALWMLTKQWQMGEFRGSDAGSPVFAKLQLDLTRLTKYRPGNRPAQLFENGVPLEATVERRPVPLVAGTPLALDLRLAMGRRWLKLVAGIGAYRQDFIDAYPIAAPDPTHPQDAALCAHPEVWQAFAAVAGKAMDGGALYRHLVASAANHAYDGIAAITNADRPAIDTAAASFLAWFRRLFLQPPPSGDDAWEPPRLEYAFAASAPLPGGGEKVYVARSHQQDRLDWYSVDVDTATQALDPLPGSQNTGLPPSQVGTTIPVPVSFAGMPNTRWWAFEDHRTNFGDIDAATTDLAKLLFMEFALVYANDWFVIPCTLPAGAVATVRGMAVTNVFGERFWIDSADTGSGDVAHRWSMFTIDVDGQPGSAFDRSLLLLPTVPKVQESPPTEEAMLLRDEVANMVWGVETTVPLGSGATMPGIEAARQLRAFLQSRLGPVPPPPNPSGAPLRYEVMNTVPENWIPFIPVHVPGSNREVQLQRAAMPRLLPGAPPPPPKVQPRTVLLREGLDLAAPLPYFVHEEEIPRAGCQVAQVYLRSRWTDGSVFTWLRVRRRTGRGEGSSGLAFDSAVPTNQK